MNLKGLSEDARVVYSYSPEVKGELKAAGARKVAGLGGLRLYECPESLLDGETAMVMRAVFLADGSGRLLYEGGLAGQPCWFVEALEIWQREKARRTVEQDG